MTMISVKKVYETKIHKHLLLISLFVSSYSISFSQFGNNKAFAKIDFSNQLHIWDGFGVNYVETCQTRDYKNRPQDLGGFSILDDKQKKEINELVFGKNGLRPQIIKMFLDPWHQETENGVYNHEWTTKNMRYFVREGLKTANSLNDSLSIITTLYGPPPFMTVHNDVANSYLKEGYKDDAIKYMAHWVKYLKEKENFPVHYLSIHNEGTDWLRWPMYENQRNAEQLERDYNYLVSPEDVAEFMAIMKPVLDEYGLKDVGITPGETINLFRFNHFGIADAIASNPQAIKNIDLVTSHGFGLGNPFGRDYANTNNFGTTVLQRQRPELKTWITSMSWGKMNTRFCAEIYEHTYSNMVNAIIPWAFIQRYSHWYGSNTNPGLAIHVKENNTYQIEKGYYLYKQFTTAGRRGMKVVKTSINRPDVFIAAYSQNNTENPDAFVVINLGETYRYVTDMIEISFTVNGNNLYYSFPIKDPVLALEQQTNGQMKNVAYKAIPNENGYTMEFAFPWKTLGGKPKNNKFKFNISVRDGRDMPHGKIGWCGEGSSFSGEISLKKSKSKRTVAISPVTGVISIDGIEDKDFKIADSFPIEINEMPGTDPRIEAEWKMTYNEENIYLFVDVKDESNDMGRRIEMTIENTVYSKFKAFRTDEFDENYKELGIFEVKNGKIEYLSPNHSTTTFIGIK